MNQWMREATSVAAVLLLGMFAVCASAAPVVLVKDGKANAVIITPEKPAPDELTAANELREHFEKISGAKLEIVTKDPADGRLPIRVGLSLSPGVEAEVSAQSKDSGAMLLAVAPEGVTVAGRSPEGTLYAAYELLERLGCRWFLPGELGTVIPASATISLEPQRTIRAPSFASRHLQGVDQNLPWYNRQRLGGTPFYGGHGITLLPAFTKGADDHLLAQVKGARRGPQMCISSPELLERAVAYVLDGFDKSPEKEGFGMGPADGGGFCECDACKKLDSGVWDALSNEPSMTDRYIWFFNQVLERVHKKYPGKKLSFYVYHTYQLPPQKIKPDPCIVPGLAPITLCRVHGMSNPICPDRSFYATLMADWCRLLPEVYERGYFFNLACPQYPFSKIHAVRDEIPRALKAGLKGWRVECMNCWPATGPTEYIAAKLMWDAGADVDALLREFYAGVFGPAAGPMGEYLTLIDHAFRDTDCHTGGSFVMLRVFTSERMARADALFAEAKKLAAGDPVYARRVAAFGLNHDRLAAFLTMIAQRDRCDFVAAKASFDRMQAIAEEMMNFPLGESPVKNGVKSSKSIPLYDGRFPQGYVKRFWQPAVQSGFDRLGGGRGELVAAFPDVWDFMIDPRDLGEVQGWHRDGKVGGGWMPAKTYSQSWADQGLHHYTGLAWYRTQVRVPAEFKGRKIFIWFGGVDDKATVWINGKPVGVSTAANVGLPGADLPGVAGTFKPFELDATDAVRFGETNFVAVRVSNEVLNEVGTGGIVAPVMFWSPKGELKPLTQPAR